MRISKIHIQNFRKLKNCTLDFGEKQTILVGANNSGKTSCIQAIVRFLKESKNFSTRDFTLSNWKSINEIAESWINDEDSHPSMNDIIDYLPQMDIWIEVENKEAYLVKDLIPSLEWEGKTVDAFVTSYIPKPNASNQMSLICSVKEYLKFEGDQKLIEIFNHWCDDDKEWAEVANSTYRGVVTGVIQSSKKCGAFVEIPELNITGFVTLKADQLGNYPPNKNVSVKFVGIEEPTYYDDATAQLKHDTPYVVEDGILRECNIKPVLEFV